MTYLSKPPLPTHWLVDGAVACGVKLTPSQYETRTTSDGLEGRWRRWVTCSKCIAAIRRRIRQLADPATEVEEAYVRKLERLYCAGR